ncbi:MAG: TolC family protein [Verrucomicrobiota bacterium]
MKHFFLLFLILALVTTERHAFAQEVSPTLESVLREALASNPELSAQFDRVKASRKIGTQVGALPDPKLTYTEFVSSVETRTGPQERAVSLTQGFPWPGKLTLRESIADENARSTFFRFEAQQRQIVREVGLAFFDYAYLGEAIRISRKNYELLEQLAPTVDTKVRAGGDPSASLRLEVETTRVEDQLQGLREQRSALSSRLESLMGRTPTLNTPLPLPTLPVRPPSIDPLESLEQQTAQHPLIAAAEAGVMSADLAERLSRKSPLPDINIGANVIDIGNGGDTAVGVIVGVSIPLSFDKYRAEREEKAELASAARADVTSMRQRLQADLHRAVQSWREATKRLDLYRKKLLPSAEQALELTEESYRNDKATVTDLIDAERTLLDLQLMNQRALSSAHKAALEIRTLTEPLSVSK